MLKVYCAMLTCGFISHNRKFLPPEPPTLSVLNVLFGTGKLRDGIGLTYVLQDEQEGLMHHVTWAPLTDERKGLLGWTVRVGYMEIMFTCYPLPPHTQLPGRPAFRHHPATILIDDDGKRREIHIGWPEGKIVTLTTKPKDPCKPAAS